MAADSSVAEKLDLDMVSRKASNVAGAFDPNKPSVGKTYEDIQARIERLQQTVSEIQSAAREITQPPEKSVTAATASAIPPIAPPRGAPANATSPWENRKAMQNAPITPRSVMPRPAASTNNIRSREMPPKTSMPMSAPVRKINSETKNSTASVKPPVQPQQSQKPATASVPVAMADVRKWQKAARAKSKSLYKALPDIGIWATGMWLAGAVLYLGGEVGWGNVVSMPAHQLGSVIAGIAAPIALIWMGINYLRRHQDIKEQIAPLMAQIDQLINPNKAVEARVEAVADGLRRQANELIAATQQVEKTLNHVRDGLRSDMEKMLEYSGLAGKNLEQASTTMANRTTQLARMTEQMHGRLASFEEHAKTGTERLDLSVNNMMTKAQGATDKLERQSNNVIAALHASNMRMQRTADDLDSRIGQIANFADQTAARFGDVAAEFARHGVVVDAASNVMREQLSNAQEQFTRQLMEMGDSIRTFAGMGSELTGAVNNFRDTAEHVVIEASQQINKYTETMQTRLESTVRLMAETMDERLHHSQASLDRSLGATVSKVGTIDRMMSARLVELQEVLTDAAAETPRMVQSILDDTTRRLLDMDMRFSNSGAQVADKLKDLERNIDTRLQAMGILAERMGEDTAGNMKQAMVTVFNELHEIQTQFTGSARETNRDLKVFHNDLAQTIEALGHVARRAADRTVERILMLNSGISQRIMDLRDTAEAAQVQGQQTEVKLAQHIGMMREANDQVTLNALRLVETGTRAASDLRDATGQAMAQAEIVSHVIGREADAMRAATAEAAASLNGTGATLQSASNGLYESVAKTAQQISNIVCDLQAQQNSFDQTHQTSAVAHAAMYHEIVRLRDATQALNGQLTDTLLATDGRAQDLRDLTTRLGEVTLGMKATMQNGHENLNSTVDHIEFVNNNTRDVLIAQSTKLAEISNQITANANQIAVSLDAQQDSIEYSVTQGVRSIDGMVEKLKSSAATLNVSVETSARDLDWLSSHILHAGEAVDQMGTRAQDAMARAREAMVISEASLQRSASSARTSLSELSERYNAEGVRLNGISDDLHHSYDNAIKRLEGLGHQLAGQSFLTFDTLTEMGTLFDARIAQLREGGDLANGQLNTAAQAMQDNYKTLTTTAEAAAQQLAQIQASLSKTHSDTDVSTEHARSRVETVRRELSAYAQDLMMMVSQASGQIDAAAAGFGAKAEAMRAAANENVGQLGEAGTRVRHEIDLLVKTVKEAMQPESGSLSTSIERLRQQAEQLAHQTQKSFQEMEQSSVRTVHNVQAMEQGAGRAAQQIQAASTQFLQRGEQIASVSQESAKRIGMAAQAVQVQTQNLKSTSENVVTAMLDSGQQTRQIVAALSAQLAQIDQINRAAGDTVQRLTQSENHARRDMFLNTAKYVIESLNSLAIDLTRVLDAKEAERTWQEFNKGNSAAFTRRFVQMRDELPIQHLREKYQADNEFRTYAARYFRQFEELFEHAIANDHNDLLATILTTSDVGKLYTYLAGALGHNKLKARAA